MSLQAGLLRGKARPFLHSRSHGRAPRRVLAVRALGLEQLLKPITGSGEVG